MSNLSLSFSFYFWWTNSSQSVTLTNSLSQSVNVFPDGTLAWFLNNPIGSYTATTDRDQAKTAFTGRAPSISEVSNNLVASQPVFPGTYDRYTGTVWFNNAVDLTGISKLITRYSKNTSEPKIILSKTKSNGYVIGKDCIDGENDVSSLSGQYYIGLYVISNKSDEAQITANLSLVCIVAV